jgi:hypothetical protein
MQTDSRAHSPSRPWGLEATSLREQPPECEAKHSPTSSTEVNNVHYLYFYYTPSCLLVMFFFFGLFQPFIIALTQTTSGWIIADKKGGRITKM